MTLGPAAFGKGRYAPGKASVAACRVIVKIPQS